MQSRERIFFKLAVLVYEFLHGLAPRYLSDHFQHVASYNAEVFVHHHHHRY